MDGTSSYGTSWADQWDSQPDPAPVSKQTTSGTAKYKQKFGEGLGKTKSVASTGMKKVKEGTSVGFQWIKDKYHKLPTNVNNRDFVSVTYCRDIYTP